jgi:hypothetical protein
LSQFKPWKAINLITQHTRVKRAPRVTTVHNNYQRVKPGPPYPSAIFHAYVSADTPWVAETQSLCTPMKYDGVTSTSMTVEATQFAGPQEISYAPVHNQTCSPGLDDRSLINLGGGYHDLDFVSIYSNQPSCKLQKKTLAISKILQTSPGGRKFQNEHLSL